MANKKIGTLAGAFAFVLALVFGLLFAGCTTATGGEEPSAEAAQLAEDINAMEGQSEGSVGKAEANGATVKITGGFLDVRADITVPAGITLDVTEDGAALGLHDVTLTVNGAVNAKNNAIRFGDTGQWAIINGSGTIYLKNKGCLLEVQGSENVAKRELTLDGVTLVGLKDNDQPLVVVGGGGEFVLKNGAITGNTRVSNEWSEGGGVEVWEGGLFTMSGGAISGNSVSSGEGAHGGGVAVHKGTFALSGGTISGNSTSGKTEGGGGGGVKVNEGTFTMSGGEISGNSTSGKKWSDGGGVKVENSAIFTMSGGTISGNTVKSDSTGASGGVHVRAKSVFTMSGGAITGNTVTASGYASGGGITVGEEDSIFTMQGGTISANTATGGTDGSGGGVKVEDGGAFILEGGTVYGNAESLPAGTDASLANSARNGASLNVDIWGIPTAKWGTGGAYKKGGASQTGGGNIGSTDDTLTAEPAP